jgi:hypothetical protein
MACTDLMNFHIGKQEISSSDNGAQTDKRLSIFQALLAGQMDNSKKSCNPDFGSGRQSLAGLLPPQERG